MLPSDLRRILERHDRPAGRRTHVFELTLERAQAEILYYQTNGHHIPRDVEFEW